MPHHTCVNNEQKRRKSKLVLIKLNCNSLFAYANHIDLYASLTRRVIEMTNH